MLCDKYNEALIEAAASGAGVPVDVREHLDECQDCCEALAIEQALFTAVDVSLRRGANAQLSDSFLHGVRARLTEERVPTRSWSPAWAAVAACAALIIGVVGVTRDRHAGTVLGGKRTNLSSAVLPNSKDEAFRKDSPKASFASSRSTRRIPANLQKVDEAQPLLLTGHREAIDQLLRRAGRGEIRGQVLLTDDGLGRLDELQIPRIAIASIVEISPESSNSNSADEPEVRARDRSQSVAGGTK